MRTIPMTPTHADVCPCAVCAHERNQIAALTAQVPTLTTAEARRIVRAQAPAGMRKSA